jgi:hypothetical protein
LPALPRSSSSRLKAISRPPSQLSSKSRLFVDLIDPGKLGTLPSFFYDAEYPGNVRVIIQFFLTHPLVTNRKDKPNVSFENGRYCCQFNRSMQHRR